MQYLISQMTFITFQSKGVCHIHKAKNTPTSALSKNTRNCTYLLGYAYRRIREVSVLRTPPHPFPEVLPYDDDPDRRSTLDYHMCNLVVHPRTPLGLRLKSNRTTHQSVRNRTYCRNDYTHGLIGACMFRDTIEYSPLGKRAHNYADRIYNPL